MRACPKCKQTNIATREMEFGISTFITGDLISAVSKLGLQSVGAAIGSAVPVVGITAGKIIGGVIGSSLAGARGVKGKQVNLSVKAHTCKNCGHRFYDE